MMAGKVTVGIIIGAMETMTVAREREMHLVESAQCDNTLR